MKRLLLAVGGPFLLVAIAAVGVVWWDRGAPPGFRPPLHDVAVEEVTREHRGVRLRGTAHYEAMLVQKQGDDVYYVFPLFPRGDTMSREIRVMVRTRRKPNELLSFEDLTVEGLARPPGSLVPRRARELVEEKGYTFAEGWVLVEAFDDETDAGD